MLFLSDLPLIEPLRKVTVHALAPMLYQITVSTDQGERLLYDDNRKPLKAINIEQIKAWLEPVAIDDFVLRHESAYDEMVGHPVRGSANTLEVPLSRTRAGY